MKQKLQLLLIIIFSMLIGRDINGQTTLIGGAVGNGNFEAGAASWSFANAAASNQWYIGAVSPASGVNSAYISSDAGVTNSYVFNTISTNHIYQSVTFPAGETAIILSFDWKGIAEPTIGSSSFDYIRVSVSSAAPVGGTAVTLADQLPVVYVGQSTYTKAFVVIPSSHAGTTKNIIFTWRNDSSLGNSTPGPSIDNVVLTSSAPSPISGAKSIPGDYTYLGEAIAAINAHGVGASGVTFNIAAGSTFNETPLAITASGTVSGPIVFQKSGSGANPVVTNSGTGNFGTTSSISSSGGGDALLTISGGDYITIDGIDVQSMNFITGSSCLEFGYLIRNSSASNGAQNNIIKNCNIILNRSITATVGIFQSVSSTQGGVTPTASTGANSNNSYLNNTVTNSYSGIGLFSNSSFPDMACEISNNTVGASYTGIPTGDIGGSSTTTYGIQTSNCSGVKVSGNTIRNIVATTTTRGLYVLTAQGTNNVYANRVYGLRNSSTTSTSSVNACEITLSTTGTHTANVYNNFVYDVTSGYTSTATSTRQLKGILLGPGAATSIYNISHNTIKIDGSGSPNVSSVCLEWGGSTAFYNVRNNIFANLTGSQSGTAVHAAVRSTSSTSIGAVGSICNYNDYYIANTTNGFPGITNTTNQTSIALWSAALTNNPGTDANSINANPGLMPTGDPYIDLSNANAVNVNNVGTPLAAVTTDIDGNARDVMTPDLGADEFILSGCFGTPEAGMVTPDEVSKCSGQSHTMTTTGTSTGQGITYQWQVSSTGNSSDYTDVTTGTGGTSSSYNTGALSTGTYYFRARVSCANSGGVDYTNDVVVTVNENPNITVESSAGTYCTPGGTAVVLSAFGGISYSWSPSGGLSANSGSPVNATPTATTTYTVTGTDENGCTNTAQTTINVKKSPILILPQTTITSCEGDNVNLNALYSTPVENYIFSASTGAELQDMDGGTIVVSNLTDDAPMNTSMGVNTAAGSSLPLPFNFSFNGTVYSHYSASPDGWLRFMLNNAAASNQFSNSVISTTNIPKVYPFWDDLHTGDVGEVKVLTVGTAPERVFVVQWFVDITRTSTGNVPTSTFQLWLYENGKIEFRYGTMATETTTASLGMTANATSFQSINVSAGTSSTTTASNSNLPPLSGTIYTFDVPSTSVYWTPSALVNNPEILNPVAENLLDSTIFTVTISQNSCDISGNVDVDVKPLLPWYLDMDGDGYGNPQIVTMSCDQPNGYSNNNLDCNDENMNISPAASESCDYIDNDCDGLIDQGVQFTYYADADGDQFGDPATDTLDCTVPEGYVSDNNDCDDTNNAIFPYAMEVCDEVDNDCDQAIDEGCGCTNPLAHNYDPMAILDDGSCETCTDGIQNGDEVNIDCGGSLCAPCPPPTAVCGNIITVYTGGGAPVYNGPGASDVWLIDAEDFDAGSTIYGTPTSWQVKRKYTNVSFNWTTDGACIDATPNSVYNNNDKGLVWRDCLPVAPADFNKIRNFDMTITDQFGTSTCDGRYIVVNTAPPGGGTNPIDINADPNIQLALESDEAFSVFPNPGINEIYVSIKSEDNDTKALKVYDILGKLVYKLDKVESSLFTIDTQNFSLGTYTIILEGASATKTLKWLKVE